MDLAALLNVTKEERFVTARHSLQSLWKVGVAGELQRKALLKGLAVNCAEYYGSVGSPVINSFSKEVSDRKTLCAD